MVLMLDPLTTLLGTVCWRSERVADGSRAGWLQTRRLATKLCRGSEDIPTYTVRLEEEEWRDSVDNAGCELL